MLIKPVENIEYEDISAVSAMDISNDIYIHDLEDMSGIYSHNSYNNIIGKATQVIVAKVRGFPRDTNVEAYSTGMNNRLSFVKFTYYYDVMLSSGYKEPKDRINHGSFRLLTATATGFSTVKPIPDYMNRSINIEHDFTNSFSLTVYTAETNMLTTVGRPKSELSHIRLNICEPIDFKVNEICEVDGIGIRNASTSFGSNNVIFSGEDLINKGPSIAKVTFVEARLSDRMNDDLYRNRLRRSLPSSNKVDNDEEVNKLFLMIELRMKIRNLIVDMMKMYHLSTLSEYTLVYRTGYKSGFRQAISPINKLIKGYTIPQMEYIRQQFVAYCRKIESNFNQDIDVKYHINQYECICRINLLKSKCEETKRMINSESIHCFITESVDGNVKTFKHDMDLDTIDYYSYHDANNYNITHCGKNL